MLTSTQTPQQDQVFDPKKDIDLSHIQENIVDTSKGQQLAQEINYTAILSFRCKSCGYRYEGYNVIEICPRCSSNELEDID